ncbi:MAG: hypothetical protein CMD16_05295 [Flavobacteriales bacterium]|nr:hypothetical protein [Flavobacteriales bacterium]|tara:strand:+ start:3966 stop:4178 length:213 start_codon:yes stop_codon:yes gene_type:complete
MNKEKLVKGGMWLSGFSISIILSAITLYTGFHNMKYENYTMLIIGLLLIPVIFFFAYKGLSLILESIFGD